MFRKKNRRRERYAVRGDVVREAGLEFPEEKSNNLYDEIMLFLVRNL